MLEVTEGEDGMIYIRETEEPDVVAVTTPAKWDAFVKGVKAGEFDHFVEGFEGFEGFEGIESNESIEAVGEPEPI